MITTTIISSTSVKPRADRAAREASEAAERALTNRASRARIALLFPENAASSIGRRHDARAAARIRPDRAGVRLGRSLGRSIEYGQYLDVKRLRHQVERQRAREAQARGGDAARIARQGLRVARDVDHPA